MNPAPAPPLDDLAGPLAGAVLATEQTRGGIPVLWLGRDHVIPALARLKHEVDRPYRLLYDLTAVDERERRGRGDGRPASDFTVVYHLASLERNQDLMLKVPLAADDPRVPSATPVWAAANWYEREAWDMFGVRFDGHPHLRRLLMPPTWVGHPLRKDHAARATELPAFTLPDERQEAEEEAMRVDPEDWGLAKRGDGDLMILNLGPQHPGTHGVLRLVLQLAGEEIADVVPDIGFHHRGAEKMGERQSWHTYIPYTDRVDYLGGVMNNLPYVLAVEQLAGIRVPSRVELIRVMLCELFRIASHLVWYGTFAQDVGALSPVFYTFNDRERILDIVAAICGFRMHPGWFRIGGVAQDLPAGWDRMVGEFVSYFDKRLRELGRLVVDNPIFKARTVGIGPLSTADAIDWGVTGPMLRATGLGCDLRRLRPYSGYQQLEFEVPTAAGGDCYARALVRFEEMRQSLRIVRQCVAEMPPGPYKALHPLTTPPPKEQTLRDIETLITHFLAVSWGPVIPAGEGLAIVEATKGWNGYYLVSDGGPISYRTRIRTPSFPHMQVLPELARGHTIADLLAIIGSIDFVLADVDR